MPTSFPLDVIKSWTSWKPFARLTIYEWTSPKTEELIFQTTLQVHSVTQHFLRTPELTFRCKRKLENFWAIFVQSYFGLDSLQRDVPAVLGDWFGNHSLCNRIDTLGLLFPLRTKKLMGQLEAEEKDNDGFLRTRHTEREPHCKYRVRPVSNVRSILLHLTLYYNSRDTFEGQLKAAIMSQLRRGMVGVFACG